MKGHIEVIDYLKTLLKGELAARDQYSVSYTHLTLPTKA